jgi:tetratricopeptide (TPR) repeat protein
MYTLRKLGLTLEAERKWLEAESIHGEALAVSSKKGEQDKEALVDLERLVRVLINEKKFTEAQQHLDRMLTPKFAANPASVILLIQRVNLMGRRGRWQEAAADVELLLQHQPNEHYHYHRLVSLLAISHSRPAYERLCQKIVATFTNSPNAYVNERVAQDCLLLPNSGVDLALMDNLADAAVSLEKSEAPSAYFQGCKAMSTYRLGHFRVAIEWAEKAVKNPKDQAQAKAKAFAIAAMANWKLGQKEAARAALAEGNKLVPNLSPERTAHDLGESWVAWILARISLDEAAELFQTGSTIDGNSNQP